MSHNKVFTAPELQSGVGPQEGPHTGERDAGRDPKTADDGADNRGRRAGVRANGEVVGSGASAGGKGGPEDYDADPQAGGGAFLVRHEEGKPDEGGDASQHNSS